MDVANKQIGSLAAVALFSALLGGLVAGLMVGGPAAAQSGISLKNHQTGQTEHRPLSSLVLVDEGGHIQWTTL